MGHVNIQTVVKTGKAFTNYDFLDSKNNKFFCEVCVMRKQSRKPHYSIENVNCFKAGEKIHTDL